MRRDPIDQTEEAYDRVADAEADRVRQEAEEETE
jgi:hypothetical protein